MGLQLGVCQSLATGGQGRFDRLLGHVDGGAARLFLFDGKLRHALHELGHLARLAQKLRLGIFQIRGGLAQTVAVRFRPENPTRSYRLFIDL
jgi:hypothetical protein